MNFTLDRLRDYLTIHVLINIYGIKRRGFESTHKSSEKVLAKFKEKYGRIVL